MTTVYKPIEFVVDNLIAQGLYILAGAPKVGKSWLSLDTCLSIAKGEKVLGHETKCGTTLYLCLEDSFERIQKRLYEITDEPTDRLQIAIVLVHHTRKCSDSDPFNMISGSTGLSGCVDGSIVLVETKRGSRKAVFHCVGRDIENQEINLEFNSDLKKWIVTNDAVAQKSKDNIFLAAIYMFIKVKIHFEGSATEPVTRQDNFVSYFPSMIFIRLDRLILYKRVHGGRKIILHYNRERDSSDSKNGSGVTVTLQSYCHA